MKVRENSRVIDKTIHIAIGLRMDGRKEVLGLWLGKNESAYFWLSILTDLKARGVQDIVPPMLFATSRQHRPVLQLPSPSR